MVFKSVISLDYDDDYGDRDGVGDIHEKLMIMELAVITFLMRLMIQVSSIAVIASPSQHRSGEHRS